MMFAEEPIGPVVIVGIGDPRRRDDAVGLFIARELSARPLPENVTLEEARTEGFDLMAALSGARRAIILAAVKTGDEPGSIQVLAPEDAEATADYLSSPGGMTLIDTLELASLGGGPEVLIVGVEPAEIVPGQTLSRAVAASVEEAARVVLELVRGERDWRGALSG